MLSHLGLQQQRNQTKDEVQSGCHTARQKKLMHLLLELLLSSSTPARQHRHWLHTVTGQWQIQARACMVAKKGIDARSGKQARTQISLSVVSAS